VTLCKIAPYRNSLTYLLLRTLNYQNMYTFRPNFLNGHNSAILKMRKIITWLMEMEMLGLYKTGNMLCETWHLPHIRVHNDWTGYSAYFSLLMRETAIFLHPVWNLTSSSRSSIPRFRMNGENVGDSQTFEADICLFMFAWIFRTSWCTMGGLGVK